MQLIESTGISPEVVEYLKHPPDVQTLASLLDLLGLEPRQLMRTHEKLYKEKGLDDPALTDEQLIEAMIEDPVLIERPIVIRGDRAVLGRPPEKVLDIL